MHKDVEDALEQIDAMMFSGDPSLEDLDTLQTYMGRWNRAIPILQDIQKPQALCSECNENPAEGKGLLCCVCDAYKDHTG
tara:strand:+ start:1873 stop:2112 length:240 start_codon:yes stop_codon:yes gene_type:complete